MGQSLDVRAAVAHRAGAPLTIETVQLDGPKAGEVLVEVKATGICHTDEFTRSGADPEGLFPAILGHEGAGIVVDVGPGVTSLKKGDHVIPLYTPEDGKINIDDLITHVLPLERINEGFDLMHRGESIRSVVVY